MKMPGGQGRDKNLYFSVVFHLNSFPFLKIFNFGKNTFQPQSRQYNKDGFTKSILAKAYNKQTFEIYK